jgi:hypothetical protein
MKPDEVLWLLDRILVGTWGVSGRRSVSLGAKKHVKNKTNAVGASEKKRNATILQNFVWCCGRLMLMSSQRGLIDCD